MTCLLNVFARNNRSHTKTKRKYLACGAIWSITWSWKGDFLVFSQGSVCIQIVWIVSGPLSTPSGSTDRHSTDPRGVRHLCAAGSPTQAGRLPRAGSVPGNSPKKAKGGVFSICSGDTLVRPNQTYELRCPDPVWRACPDLPSSPQTEQTSPAHGPNGVRGFLTCSRTFACVPHLPQCKGMHWANIFCSQARCLSFIGTVTLFTALSCSVCGCILVCLSALASVCVFEPSHVISCLSCSAWDIAQRTVGWTLQYVPFSTLKY